MCNKVFNKLRTPLCRSCLTFEETTNSCFLVSRPCARGHFPPLYVQHILTTHTELTPQRTPTRPFLLHLSLCPPGFLTATVSTGSNVQRIVKHLGTSEPATTEPITAELELSGRSGVLHQLNQQRHHINGSHTAQLTATGVLILNSASGEVVQTISPLICPPRQLAVANGINTGSTSQPIILLVLCQTRRVLAMIEIEGQFVIRAYITRNIQSNLVAITMSTSGGSPATGLAFLNNDNLFHLPYLSGSPFPVLFVVSSSRSCQEPALSSLNTTHYLLVCQDKFYTVDKDAQTKLIGSRVQDSKISSSENGEVVVLSTDTNAEVRTNYLTQTCSLDVTGLVTVDFAKVENSTFVLLFTSQGVYIHNVSTGCPTSTPSLLTTTPVAPVCLEQQACYGYYFTEDSNLLFITSLKSTDPDIFEVEAYDIVSNTSVDINFILNEPPLLIHYQPLPPLLPSSSPLPDIATTSITLMPPAPSVSPSPNPYTHPIKPYHIAIIAMGIVVLILSLVLTILGIACCVARRRHRVKRKQVPLEERKSNVITELSSLDSNDQHRAPVQEIGGAIQETDLGTLHFSQPATTLSFHLPPFNERGPSQPDLCVPQATTQF